MCQYKGVSYLVFEEEESKKKYINVDGEKKYLDCNGIVVNKKAGKKQIKTAFENFEDMKKIQDYFLQNKQWNFYLLYTLGINTARRISDLLAAKWSDFFYKNGNIKKFWYIIAEKKTGKSIELYINVAVQEAFRVFLKNENINFNYDYEEPIFKQLHGTHRGRVVSSEGYRRALIKASSQSLDYEIRSHSMRRGFGKMIMQLHPNDNVAKSVLMELYNHSSEKMTTKYIGETDKLKKEYLEDFGSIYNKYVQKGENIPFLVKKPVSVYDNSELRNYMMCAFGRILDNKNATNPLQLMHLYNELLDGLEKIAK